MLSLRYLHSTRSANVHGPLRHVGDELKDQVFQCVYSLRVRVWVVAVSEKLIHIKCLKEIKTESFNFYLIEGDCAIAVIYEPAG